MLTTLALLLTLATPDAATPDAAAIDAPAMTREWAEEFAREARDEKDREHQADERA